MHRRNIWHKAKILFFDKSSGEGIVIDENDNHIFVHHTALLCKPEELTSDKKILIKIYENGYLRQVERLKLGK